MKKHFCAGALCASFLMTGCFTLRSYTVEQRDQIKESQRIYKLRTNDGEIVRFDSLRGGFAVLRDSVVEHTRPDSTVQRIPLSDVMYLYAEEGSSDDFTDFLAAMGWMVGVPAVAFAVAFIVWILCGGDLRMG